MKVRIDPDTCTECGVCADNLPEVFGQEDDGKGVVKVDPIPAELEAATRDVADQCPTGAIIVED